MESPVFAVLALLVLIVFMGGCIQPPSSQVTISSGTPAPVPPATVTIPSPLISGNQTSGTTPTIPGISIGVPPGSPSGPNYFQVPIADFGANRTSGRSPLAIGFSDRSSLSPTRWSWDFGDGTIAHEKNPTHVYAVSGTYSVRLNASNNAGSNTVTRVDYITVMPEFLAPVASFGFGSQGSLSGIIQFTDYSFGPPTNWSWDFGDGESSHTANPVHIFETPGNYLVSLTVSNPSGTSVTKRELLFGGSP
jgi:PKD repeat protein